MKLRIFGVGVGIESTNKYLLMLVFVVLNSDPDTDSDPDRLRDSPAGKSIHLRYGASPYRAPAGTAQIH